MNSISRMPPGPSLIWFESSRRAGAVAAQGARLDPGIALPLAAVRHEILLQRIEARRQRATVAPGTQAHVDAEHEAVLGALAERRDQPLPESGVALQAVPRSALVRMEKHQVDVGGHVQLAAAELAH